MDKRRTVPTAEQIAELATTSDREMERRYGTTQGVWRRTRAEHGIAKFREWKRREPAAKEPVTGGVLLSAFWRAPDPSRDTSLAGEAAAFLRSMRFPNVFSRARLGMGDGWQVGRSVLSEAEMVGKAERLGFKREGWMG